MDENLVLGIAAVIVLVYLIVRRRDARLPNNYRGRGW